MRSFLTAFLAIGSRDLLAVTSNEKMLQSEPSSYESQQSASCLGREAILADVAYASSSIVQGPDEAVEVDLVTKRVGKGRPLGDG